MTGIRLLWALLAVGAVLPSLAGLVQGPVPGMGGFRVPIVALELTTDPAVFTVAHAAFASESAALDGLFGLDGPAVMVWGDMVAILPLYVGLAVWAGVRGIWAEQRAVGIATIVCALGAGAADAIENLGILQGFATPTDAVLTGIAQASRAKWACIAGAYTGLAALHLRNGSPAAGVCALLTAALFAATAAGAPLLATPGLVALGLTAAATARALRDPLWPMPPPA